MIDVKRLACIARILDELHVNVNTKDYDADETRAIVERLIAELKTSSARERLEAMFGTAKEQQ